MRRGSPYPLTKPVIDRLALAGEHGPKKGPCYPRLSLAGPIPARARDLKVPYRPRRYRAIPMARPLLWDIRCPDVHHRWPYLGHLTVGTGPCMGRYLAIEPDPYIRLSSSWPAGQEQCGVPRAPGALGTDDAVSPLWPMGSDAFLESWAGDACPSLSRNAIGPIDVEADKHLTQVSAFPGRDRGMSVPDMPIMQQWDGLSLLASPIAKSRARRIWPWTVEHGRIPISVLTGLGEARARRPAHHAVLLTVIAAVASRSQLRVIESGLCQTSLSRLYVTGR